MREERERSQERQRVKESEVNEVSSLSGVSTFSSVCVSINMMIGAGMLALPSGFVKAGVLSSLSILSLICIWMVLTCLWEGRAVVQCGRILKIQKIPEGQISLTLTLALSLEFIRP